MAIQTPDDTGDEQRDRSQFQRGDGLRLSGLPRSAHTLRSTAEQCSGVLHKASPLITRDEVGSLHGVSPPQQFEVFDFRIHSISAQCRKLAPCCQGQSSLRLSHGSLYLSY
jgi:hypothetical protein